VLRIRQPERLSSSIKWDKFLYAIFPRLDSAANAVEDILFGKTVKQFRIRGRTVYYLAFGFHSRASRSASAI
jgi:hypothetical protein